MGKQNALTLGTVVVLLGLTGCSVPSNGWMGLLRSESDSLFAVVQMCDESVDGATIYKVSGPGEQTTARAHFGNPVSDTGAAEIATLEDLDAEKEYRLYGWTDANTSSAAGPNFTRNDVARLDPGEMLAIDLDADEYTTRTVSPEDFKAMVLSHCDK